jgi:hypothetical protein
MSRTPASYGMVWVRGSTVEEEFTYVDSDCVPVDLTGYEARMQIRTMEGEYGTSTDETLVLELTTTGQTPMLFWDTPAEGRLRLLVSAAVVKLLNPDNLKRTRLAYSIEVYIPEGTEPEYVIPLVRGRISVQGEVTR